MTFTVTCHCKCHCKINVLISFSPGTLQIYLQSLSLLLARIQSFKNLLPKFIPAFTSEINPILAENKDLKNISHLSPKLTDRKKHTVQAPLCYTLGRDLTVKWLSNHMNSQADVRTFTQSAGIFPPVSNHSGEFPEFYRWSRSYSTSWKISKNSLKAVPPQADSCTAVWWWWCRSFQSTAPP